MSPLYVYFVASLSGAASMALEMAASRLLLPFYGDSYLIWTNIIGLILASLTAGYYFGGAIADRRPSQRLLSGIVGTSGLWTFAVSFTGRQFIEAVQQAFPRNHIGFLVSSFLSVFGLFALPAFLLGCVSPFAIRLSVANMRTAGRVTGKVYAVSTIGSVFGTFVPVLWLMPTLGVQRTFLAIASTLLAASLLGLFLSFAGTGISDQRCPNDGRLHTDMPE